MGPPSAGLARGVTLAVAACVVLGLGLVADGLKTRSLKRTPQAEAELIRQGKLDRTSPGPGATDAPPHGEGAGPSPGPNGAAGQPTGTQGRLAGDLTAPGGGRIFQSDGPTELRSAGSSAHCEDCDIFLVTMCSLRKDHVGAYGNPKIDTPAMDRLAREGIRFTRAIAPAPTTLVPAAGAGDQNHASGVRPAHIARHAGFLGRFSKTLF